MQVPGKILEMGAWGARKRVRLSGIRTLNFLQLHPCNFLQDALKSDHLLTDTLCERTLTMQRFYANPSDTLVHQNGAIGYRPGGPFDCLGPYAKVKNCPIEGFPGLRLTAYAQGYADTYFSVPAATRYRGQRIKGYFTDREDGPVFVPFLSEGWKLPAARFAPVPDLHEQCAGQSELRPDYLQAMAYGIDANTQNNDARIACIYGA